MAATNPPGTSHADRIEALARSVRGALGEPSLVVRPWRSGLDFWADLAEIDTQLVVLRSPRIEVLQTSYEGLVDYGATIEREVHALGLMASAGLPVPEVVGWQRAQRAGEASWVLLSYVPHDEAADIPMTQLGELTRRLHAIEPSRPGLTVPESWSGFVWSRLRQRLDAARAYCQIPAEEELQPGVTALLESRSDAARSLLHMDLRAANLCIRDGRIAAVIDVANCLVGDPMLELGRLRCFGLLTDAFLSGYGLDLSNLNADELTLLDVYELDTAALLTVVAVEETDDPDLHKLQRARTECLAAQLARRFMPAGQCVEPGARPPNGSSARLHRDLDAALDQPDVGRPEDGEFRYHLAQCAARAAMADLDSHDDPPRPATLAWRRCRRSANDP